MKLRRILSPAAVLLFAAACGSERPSEEDYLSVVRQSVRVAEQHARENAGPGSGTGPLLLDVASFRAGGHRAVGEAVEREKIARVVDRPFQPTPRDSSFTCMELELGNSCWVPKDGVYVRLNLVSRAPGQFTMLMGTTTTAAQFIPRVLCDRILRLVFVKRGKEWVLQEQVPTRSC